MMVVRQDIVDYARTLVGVRYRHCGRSLETGVDCIGLLVLVARHLGLTFYDCTTYSKRPSGELLLEELRKGGCVRRRTNDLVTGSIVVFRIHSCNPQHVGIVTDRGGVIHTWTDSRKVVEHELDDYWTPKLHSVHDFPLWQL